MRKALFFCLATLPPCLLGMLIVKFSVDVPFGDQWTIAFLFEKFAQGTLSFNDLFAQQNEYRQFFPNLIFVMLGWLTYWNVKYEMLLIFLLACFISHNIYRLSGFTLGHSQPRRLVGMFIANLFIFSPVQHENWLFGVQVIYFIPIACVTVCLLIAYSDLSARAKFLSCAGLSTLSTFSSANGVLCWAVVLPALILLTSREERPKKYWLVSGWVCGIVLNLALYLYDYQKPSHHPSLSATLVDPGQATAYFFSFLGAPLALGRWKFAIVEGAVLVSLFVLSFIYFLKFRTDLALARRMIGWLMLGAYSVLSALMVTIGRVGFGLGQSLSTRYMGYSIYLIVSLIFLIPIIADDWFNKGHSKPSKILLTRIMVTAAGILIFLQPLIFILAIRQMSDWRARLLHAKAGLLFINIIPDQQANGLFPNLDLMAQKANALDGLNFLRPGLLRSNRIRDFAGVVEPGFSDYGAFDGLDGLNDTYTASGWAILPHREGEPADAVLLAYGGMDGDPFVFALAYPETRRGGGVKNLIGDTYSHQHWRKSFSIGELPLRPARITAWAFDANTGKAFQLNGAYTIP